MKPRFTFSPGFPYLIRTALVLVSSPLAAVPITWDNSNGTGAWSTAANWDTNTEPTAADDLTFPLSLAGMITLTTTENARSLQFDGGYTLSGGTLALASGNSIGVADGVTATINNAMTITGGLSKTGTGTLVLAGSNTNAGGTVISAGRIRAASTGAMGAAGAITTVNGGATLEIGGIALDRPITLKDGGKLLGTGTATSNGVTTLDAAAASVTLGTESSSDVLTLSTAANELTGGTASTVINIGGPGAVRLNLASNFPGSWNLPSGRLELVANGALGSGATSVTLSGGTLVGRSNTGLVVTGPGSNLLLTANSSILSDRTAASNGAGVNHTFGTLSMGSLTLTVAPGVNPTSGTAGITLGNLTLTGNPQFAVNDSGATNGLLTTGSLLGGGIARTITKTGAGDLAVTGGTTDLPAGSALTATGGGTIEMLFPDLGAGSPLAVTDVQNPFGAASISLTDGALRLLANGSGTSAVQTFQVASAITLGGTVLLDVDERSGANSAKTFELTGLTLTPGTVLSQSGANTYGVRLTGPLVMQGNATLKGSDTASRPGILALDGGVNCASATTVSLSGGASPLTLTIGGVGIAGGPSTAVALGGGTNPLTLTIGAASTYGGGTTMSGGTVTLNATGALGGGPLVMNGGSLVVNADNPLGGAISLNGGTLRVNDTNALGSTPVNLNGGTLDFRNNTTAVISTGTLTFSGTSTLSLGNNGSGSSQTFEFPTFNVSGTTALTVTPANTYTPYFNGVSLAGNLTLSNTGTLRVKSVTQDAPGRILIKAGTGTLELEDASSHSGGTEVIAGILQVEAPGALGSGTLTLGDSVGATAATANFINGLTMANSLLVRAGSNGLLTLGFPGGGVTWDGGITLQNALTLANGSTSFPSILNGPISGSGVITKSNVNSEIEITNAANSFVGNILISGGTLTVASDGALGNASNGVSLTGATSSLKVKGTFSSSRTLTFSNIPVGINVTAGNEFTLNQSLAGSGTFIKTGPGIMTIGPAVDSSLARAGAVSSINGGTLRLQGAKNLSDNGNLTISSGTVELLRDANTTFPHIVTANDTGAIHVDRGIGGSGTNGRHTLGAVSMDTGSLTVTGANGYGLSFGALTTLNTSTVTNNAPGELLIDSLGVSGGSSSPAMTFGGTGTTRITGAINSGAQTIYGITKTGAGTLRFGTSVIGFARAAVVNDGTLDLNGLTYNVNALTMGGATSALGAQLVTGGSGLLALGGTLTFNSAASQAAAVFTGNLSLGAASRSLVIGDNTSLPVDLTINGPVSGSAGAAIDKSGAGTLRLSGAGNTQPGLVTVSGGVLELAKSSGDGIGTGGLSVINNGSVARLVSGEQINNSAAVSIGNSGFLELADFTETTGPITFTQTTPNQYGAIKTGATGTLVLNGNLTFNNNTNTLATTSERNVLITGTGTKSVATTTGTLDLGGAVRTIHVTSNGPSTNANATIETRVINGGILKTGPRTLFLTNPDNSFAGGLQIAQGFVRPGTGTSLGLGSITFSNTPGIAAGIDLNTVTGILTNNFTATGGGESGFTYSALAPSSLVLSGAFNIAGEIVFNVVEGTVIKGSSAVLDVTGTITDGAGTFGLRKQGNGTLKLAAGNTFGGGTTIEKGILAIAADSALGDSTAPLTIDGGSLASSASFILARDVVIGSNGGNLRADDVSHALELTGALTWSPGTTTVDGPGRTVLSGTTNGPGGNLVLGAPIAFATGTTTSTSWNSRFCLLGTAALPAGNLSIVNGAVLELGNSDFTRPLGTGPGEVQLPTSQGAGWAAVGANRSVNLGGAGGTLVWGQVSPAFLYSSTTGTGPLVLGSISGTHTVEFQNPVQFTGGASGVTRTIITNDGPATVDARITGDLGQAGSPLSNNLILNTLGTLEIPGSIRGNIGLTHSAAGRTILSGTNDIVRQLRVTQGTLELANNASLGTPQFIEIDAGATLDASALTVPVTTLNNVFLTQTVNGVLDGDLQARGALVGNGQITGNLTVTTPFTNFTPTLGGTFRIGGDMDFAADTQIDFIVNNVTPETGYNRIQVTGAVNLAGSGSIYADFMGVPENFTGTLVFILNDGTDPINGTFAGYQENDLIPLGDGRSLQITYLANGDGGPVGNDFGATVVGTSSATDLSLTATATAAVAPLGDFNVVYTVENVGLNPASNPFVRIPRPFDATFAPPYPANSAFSNPLQDELFVAIDSPLAAGATAPSFTVHFTAPGTTGSVSVEANVESTSFDLNSGNDFYGTITAVLPGGAPVVSVYNVNNLNGVVQVGVDTIPGIQYVFQRSLDLKDWENVFPPFFGTGSPILVNEDVDETKEFFRFGIVPQGGNFGGGGLE
jgi:autotransporter-associated beta strand protein